VSEQSEALVAVATAAGEFDEATTQALLQQDRLFTLCEEAVRLGIPQVEVAQQSNGHWEPVL